MKKDILVIRESIGRVVSMLTMQSIKVTQRGSNAYVKYHPVTGAILEVNIPFLPDDASDEFIAAVQGFLDHEVGHVLYSSPETLKKAAAKGKRVANMANIIEDVFVESKMSAAFRGSGTNLDSTRKFFLDKIIRPKIEAALKAGNIEEARGYAVVPAFRAWGGQTVFIDFIAEPGIAELVKPLADKMGPELIDAVGACRSSDECLDLAVKAVTKLEEKKPPAPPEKAPPAPPSDDSGESDEGDDEKGEPEDKGTSKVEDDDSGKSGSEESEALEGETEGESGDSDGTDTSDKEEKGDSEPEDGDEPKEPDEGDEPEAGGKSDGDEGESEEKPDDKKEESSGDPLADTPDSDAGEKSASEGGEDGDSDEDGEGESEEAGPSSDPLAEMFDTERDFDKDIGERLSKDAKKEIEDSSYAVFSTEWDKIIPAPMSNAKNTVEKLEAKIRDKVAVMQKQLERGLAAKARKSWITAQRKGRINPGSLFKTAAGDDRVFRQRYEISAKNTAVSLLVDCSGSMSGTKIKLAGEAAFALSSVLDRLKIVHEVIGFTSGHSGEMVELMKMDAASHGKGFYDMGWGRIEPLYMPVFKPFAGKLDSSARSRIAHLTENPGWLTQNVDGESVQIAAHRLAQQKAERHVLIVLSDGEPCCSHDRGLHAHLAKTIKELIKKNIEVIGIGIQSTAVKSFYPKHVVLNDAEELPARVIGELTKLLLAP